MKRSRFPSFVARCGDYRLRPIDAIGLEPLNPRASGGRSHAGDPAYCLDTTLGHRCIHGIPAAAADTKDANTSFINVGQRHEMVDDMAEVFDGQRGILNEAWLATAGPLKAAIEGSERQGCFGRCAITV